jgi:hypothetical protein
MKISVTNIIWLLPKIINMTGILWNGPIMDGREVSLDVCVIVVPRLSIIILLHQFINHCLKNRKGNNLTNYSSPDRAEDIIITH